MMIRHTRAASAVVALSLAAALTACVGNSPEGRDAEDGAVDKVKDKVSEVRDDPEKAKQEANEHADQLKERGLREKDNYNYETHYTWLSPGDTLLVEGEQGRYDVTIDQFRTVDLTDGEDVVADLGCYDMSAAEVGSVDGPEDARLRGIEQTFFADYTDPESPSTRPYLTMLIDDGSDPGAYYADPSGSLEGGTTLSVPVDTTGEVDVADIDNIVTDDGTTTEPDEDEDEGSLQDNARAGGLDEWRSQYGFGKGGDDTAEDESEAETVEPFDEGIGEVGHAPLSLTQARCVVISGGVPDGGASGSSGVNAGGGAQEVEARPEDISAWLAWWRGPVGAPETDDGTSYGGWEFPLEASDEDDE